VNEDEQRAQLESIGRTCDAVLAHQDVIQAAIQRVADDRRAAETFFRGVLDTTTDVLVTAAAQAALQILAAATSRGR
jgi:hypothetical protein